MLPSTSETENPVTVSFNKKKHFTSYRIYPWLLMSLCASLLFYKYILNVSPSIMSQELMQQFKTNGTQLGSLSATFFYTYTLVQFFSGVLLDKFGSRLLTGFSILLGAVGAWLFSLSETLFFATLARGMMGVGIAFATVTYLKMTAVWFKPKQMAFVGGLLATAVMLGAVFGQAPLAILLEKTSWRFVLKFCAILGIIIASIYLLLARDRCSHLTSNIQRQGFSWQEFKKVLRNKQNWLLTIYSGLAFAPFSALGGLWGVPFIQACYHLTRSVAAGFMSFIFIGFGIGGPLLGLLSDRLGNRLLVMKLGVLLSFIALIFLLYFSLPLWLLSLFLFLFGFGVGAFMLGFTVGTQTNSFALTASVIALINTGDSIFESLTEPLLGKLLDWGWQGQMVDGIHYFSVANYHGAFLLLPFYFLIAYVLLFFIKEKME